jgi:excisionase family DNA binding protein
MKGKKLLLTKEAASILRISEEHLRLLIRKNKISAYKEGRRGGYRITQKEIDKYIINRCRNETQAKPTSS